MFIKGILVEIENYRSKEREIHNLLVGQENYNSDFYCGANNTIDIKTIDGKAVIPCIEQFEPFLNSKGIFFEQLEVEILINDEL